MTPLNTSRSGRNLVKVGGIIFILLGLLGSMVPVFSAPPTIVGEVRWKTRGENPTFLDLYPLYGRDARTQVYVQADLTSDAPIDEGQIQIFIDNPIALPDTFQPSAGVEVIKGNGGNATIQASISVRNDIDWPAYTPGTTLSLKMRARDAAGVEAIYDIGEIGLYGPKEILPDLILPEIVEATINNGEPITLPENMEEDSFEYSGSIRVTDAGKGMDSASLFYRHESGASLSIGVDRMDLLSGTVNDGVFIGTSNVAKYAPPGNYELWFYSIEDKAGNGFSSFNEEFPPGLQQTVVLINPNSDPFSPELGVVIVTPASVDVTTEPMEFTFSFSLSDMGSGISFGTISLFHSTDPDVSGRSGFISPSQAVTGDAFMGTYEAKVIIPVGQSPGDYIYQIRATDMAGNSVTWGKTRPESSFEPLPLPTGSTEMVTIINTAPDPVEDTTPPVLESIAIVCDSDLAEADGEMTVTLVVSEDMPPDPEDFFFGGSIWFRMTSPTGATDIIQNVSTFHLIDGAPLNGTYEFTVFLNKAIEPGPYCISVHLENGDGYENNYGLNYDDLPFPNEFPGIWTIVNTGVVDYAAPVLDNFSVTPGVATEGTDVTLNVTMRVTELMGTGLQDGNLTVRNGISPYNPFRGSLFSTFTSFLPPDVEGGVGEGTKFDGTYTFEIPLSGSEFSGDFLSFSIRLTDCAGHTVGFDTSICNWNGTYPLPYHIAQVEIIPVIDENDYQAYALGQNSPFPFEAQFSGEADYDFDYDGDGKSNGDEWAAGTDPTNPYDYFWAMVGYTPEEGTKVIFGPYTPLKNQYTLYSAFEGEGNSESVLLNATAQVYEEDSSYGCFTLPPSQGVLENIQLLVSTEKTAL